MSFIIKQDEKREEACRLTRFPSALIIHQNKRDSFKIKKRLPGTHFYVSFFKLKSRHSRGYETKVVDYIYIILPTPQPRPIKNSEVGHFVA